MSITDEALRDEVRTWLDEHWKPEVAEALANEAYGWETSDARKEWLGLVLEGRWSVPRWPEEWYGRDLEDQQAKIIEREFARVRAPGTGQDRMNLWANTLLTGGTQGLKEQLISRVDGEGK